MNSLNGTSLVTPRVTSISAARALPLAFALALGAAVSVGCAAPVEVVENEVADESAAEAERTGEAASAIDFRGCTRSFTTCTNRCRRLSDLGEDATQCESDCGASLNSCRCNVTPHECVGE